MHIPVPGGGGGGTLIFSCIPRLGPFFLVQNFEFHFLGGFQKNKYFLGYEDFVDIFLGSSQNWTIFRVHFYAFKGLFLRSSYRMGYFLWVCKISNIILGCLKFLIFFGGEW